MFQKYFKVQRDTVTFVIIILLEFAVLMHIDIYLKNKLQFRRQKGSDMNSNAMVHERGLAAFIRSSRNASESWNPDSSVPRSPDRVRSGIVKNIPQKSKISTVQIERLKKRKQINGNYASVHGSRYIVPKRELRNYDISYHNWNRTHRCLIPSSRKMMMPIEDLYCIKMPQVLPNFKNPCWFAESNSSQQPTLRCLPYFHVFGVCKSGTSDLFLRLLNHPQIVPNTGFLHKETWYWTWRRYGVSGIKHKPAEIVSFNDYLDVFNTTHIQSYSVSLEGGEIYFPLVTGHGDPMDFWDHTMWKYIPQNNYLADEPDVLAPDLIRHINPEVKLILILRNPLERLYSHYLHGNYGDTAITFHVDVVQSVQAMRSCTSQHNVRACVYNERFINSLKVPLSASMYVVHLKEWLRVFPRQQIFILRFEDYIQDLENSLRNLFDFLQLDDIPDEQMLKIVSLPRFYKTTKKNSAGYICRETEQVLRHFFHPYTRDLAALLNDSLYTWDDVNIGKACL
ncbi:hypothetical protein ACJMK2_025414 [Sinanodonta woodiana]|uniref:Sulfotransferase domain-containing protein n=1 Tax=Sinanodonta woodiana TaxID=1069815 RepID=A0ABD3XK81_SINWO